MSFWDRVAKAEQDVSRWPRWKVAAAERVYGSTTMTDTDKTTERLLVPPTAAWAHALATLEREGLITDIAKAREALALKVEPNLITYAARLVGAIEQGPDGVLVDEHEAWRTWAIDVLGGRIAATVTDERLRELVAGELAGRQAKIEHEQLAKLPEGAEWEGNVLVHEGVRYWAGHEYVVVDSGDGFNGYWEPDQVRCKMAVLIKAEGREPDTVTLIMTRDVATLVREFLAKDVTRTETSGSEAESLEIVIAALERQGIRGCL